MAGHPALGHVSTLTPRLYANEVRLRSLAIAHARWSDWWTESDDALALGGRRTHRRRCHRPEPSRSTLVHGDPRSDNLLFPVGGGEPIIIDWAIGAVAHPWLGRLVPVEPAALTIPTWPTT